VKAAVLWELNAPLRIESGIEVPPPGQGQVLVKLAYSGVCHSQLMEARGDRGPDRYLPHLLGHEGSGVVASVGPGVTKVREGDKVILGWIKGSGLDVPGGRYRLDGRAINAGPITTFNEYAVISENRCVPLPAGVPLDIAVLFGCAVPTGAGIVLNTLRPRSGCSIAFFGAGGIGLSALMASRLFDCSERIVVDIDDTKLELAKDFGATRALNGLSGDPVAAIRGITAGQGVDYSVESAGLVETIEQAFAAVRKGGGLCVFASHPRSGLKIALDPHDLISGKRIQGTWGGESDPDRDTSRFAELYRSGTLPLHKMITKRYSLEEVNTALGDLERRRVVRPLIEIDSSLG
jgi:S-(hydroxymethyl)glutathione dehydrogenase/alcohol dehydrogenase